MHNSPLTTVETRVRDAKQRRSINGSGRSYSENEGLEYPDASGSLILSDMGRPHVARWTLFTALSFFMHLSIVVVWVLSEPSDNNLPRIYLHEVVGVPMETRSKARTPQPIEREGRDEVLPEREPTELSKEITPQRPVEPPPQKGVEAIPAETLEKVAKAVPVPPPEEIVEAEPREEAPQPETAAPTLPVDEEGTRPNATEEIRPDQSPDAENADSPTEEEEPLTPEEILALPEALPEEEQRLERVLVDGSKVVVFMRTQRITESQNASAVRRAMRAVPGYKLYLGQSAFDPLTDFEWMMARNPNLSSTTTTALMAQLAVDEDRAKAAVARIPENGASVAWSERGTAATASVTGEPQRSAIRRVGWAVVGSPEPLYLAGPRRWVERTAPGATNLVTESPIAELLQVRIAGEPADLTIATGRMGSLFGPQNASAPSVEGLLLAMRFDESDTVAVRIWLRTDNEARRFVQQARRELVRINDNAMARLFDLTTIAGLLELHQQGPEVTAYARLDPEQTARLLNLVAVMLQRGQANGSRGSSHSN